MSRLSVIGLGWLGIQIGEYFQAKGYTVSGTATTKEKVEQLRKQSFMAEKLNVEDADTIDAETFMPFHSQYIIITIPPSSTKENYGKLIIKLLKKIIEANPGAEVYYTSSTSVYGSTVRNVDESSSVDPQTQNAFQMVEIEEYMQAELKNYGIFRLGGLVGENRHPINYLSGRKELSKPKAAVNLVHASDICRVIEFAMQIKSAKGIINVVTPAHPTKENYYQTVAKNLSLTLPKFAPSDTRLGKQVEPLKLIDLGFQFDYTTPYQYPQANKPTR